LTSWITDLIANEARRNPDLFRAPPAAETLLAYREQKYRDAFGVAMSAEARLTAYREIQSMSADQILAEVPEGFVAPNQKPLGSPTKATPDTRTPEQVARGYTAEDIVLEQRGVDLRRMSALQRIEARNRVKAETRTVDLSQITVAKHLMARDGKAFTDLDPTLRVNCARAAHAAGKRLDDLLK
jgi:hypothetical protein